MSVFNDPVGRKLRHAINIGAAPGYVKSAPSEGAQDFSKLASDWFADPSTRRYPVNNKANTWLSIFNFVHDKEAMSRSSAEAIGSRLAKEASVWDIDMVEATPVEDAPVYNIPLNVGGKVAHTVSVGGPKSWKEAAMSLASDPGRLPYGCRRQLALGLLNAPAEFKGKVSEKVANYLEKAAGFGMATRSDAGRVLIKRAAMLGREYPDTVAALTDWAEAMPKTITPDVLSKTASLVDMADRSAGLDRFYRKGVETPEEALFLVLEKDAQEMIDEVVTLQNGMEVSRTSLMEREADIQEFLARFLGEIEWSTPEEMVDIISTLPKPDADALVNAVDLGPVVGDEGNADMYDGDVAEGFEEVEAE